MDPLGGWTTARRCPRTPGRGSAPVKRHSRIAVAGEQPHPRSRMGRSRRQTHRTTPIAGIGGLRRAAAQHPSSPPRTRRSGATPPTEEAATWPPATHLGTGRSIPRRPIPSPKWAAPAAHKHWAARRPTPGKRQPTWGLVLIVCSLALLGQERPLAYSATPPPPSTPKGSQPRPGSNSLRGTRAGRTLPGGAKPAQGASLLPSGTVPHRTGRKPGHGPFVPGHVGPALIQPLYRTDARDVT
jgi:hypothetical protein